LVTRGLSGWYDIEYWFSYLGLGSSEPAIQSCLGQIAYYPEVTEVLSSLASEYKLIVASGTPLERHWSYCIAYCGISNLISFEFFLPFRIIGS